jgi:hypothetical protein
MASLGSAEPLIGASTELSTAAESTPSERQDGLAVEVGCSRFFTKGIPTGSARVAKR